jgi:hypothetical protein
MTRRAVRAGQSNVVAVYRDEGISGTTGRDQRPGLNALRHRGGAVRGNFGCWR